MQRFGQGRSSLRLADLQGRTLHEQKQQRSAYSPSHVMMHRAISLALFVHLVNILISVEKRGVSKETETTIAVIVALDWVEMQENPPWISLC